MFRKKFMIQFLGLGCIGGVLVLLLIALVPFDADHLQGTGNVVLTDRYGAPLRRILPSSHQDMEPVSLDHVSKWVPTALIAAEDRRFRRHVGLDPVSLMRAVLQNAVCMKVVSGASTLSTQVIRMAEPRSRTLLTKWLEMAKALKMERALSKDAILEQYINRMPMGGNIRGVQRAAQVYFGVDASALTLAEAALLAGLPQSPARYRPDKHPERARLRRSYVLRRMEACGMITTAQRIDAEAAPMALHRRPAPFREPHFCDAVQQRYADEIRQREQATHPAQHHMQTSLDPDMQQQVDLLMQQLIREQGADGPDSMAVVVMQVSNSAVRAMVSYPDYDAPRSGKINYALVTRSAGSTLKPFLYAMAMNDGWLSPETPLDDSAMQQALYRPQNADRSFRGQVSATEALRQSLNIPAVRVLRRVGVDRFINLLHGLAIASVNQGSADYGLSLALGTADVRLIDLVNAYACLARGGTWMPWTMLNSDTNLVSETLFSPETSWFVADILQRPVSMDVAAASSRQMHRFAWKTGTSNGRRDAWCLGYNPEYVVGVWMGNTGGEGSDVLVGSALAAPLVASVFHSLYAQQAGPWYTRPSGIPDPSLCQRVADPLQTPCKTTDDIPPIHIMYPRNNDCLVMPAYQTNALSLYLKVEGPLAASRRLYWFADGKPIPVSCVGEPVPYAFHRGRHRISCHSDLGQKDEIQFSVE
ncbi:MAG: penicillin-binding protein 1C [Spartobacteria bacterium]|nr:penicillin-binding protein 1C [Spartobacteria bacterium]